MRLGLEALLLVGAWAILINLLCVKSRAFAQRGAFLCLLGLTLLVLLAGPLARLVRRLGLPARLRPLTLPLLCGTILAFGWFHLYAFVDQVRAPRNKARLVDIGQNTYEAARMLFSGGINPYAFRGQIWNDVVGAPHVTRKGDQLFMYEIPYNYGYPYYPGTFLSYEPFRQLIRSYNAVRVGNLVFLGLNVLGLWLLARRLARREDRVLAGAAMSAAFLSSKMAGYDLFSFGVIDIVIPVYLLFGLVAIERGRDATAGTLLGLAQACKLFPGALVGAITFFWYGSDGRRRLRFLLAFAGAVALVMGPFVLWDPESFFSGTFLYYVTFHAEGDPTAYYSVLPPRWRGPFSLARWPLIVLVTWLGFRRRARDPRRLILVAAVGYMIFLAFNKMMHLNYLWAISSLSSAALVLQASPPTVTDEA